MGWSREGLTEEVLFELGIGGCVGACQVEKGGKIFIPAKKIALEEASRGAVVKEMSQVKGLGAWFSGSDPSHCHGGLCRAELGLLQVTRFCVDSSLKWDSDSLEQGDRVFPPAPPVLCLLRAARADTCIG